MYTLNLLDPQRKNMLREQVAVRRLSVFLLELVVLVAVYIAALYIISAALLRRQDAVSNELSATRLVSPSGTTLAITETTKRLNERLRVLKPLAGASIWDSFLIDVAGRIPPGISLTGLTLSTKTSDLRLTGTAKTRNDIPLLQKGLDQVNALSQIKIQSNLNERENITFVADARFDSSKVENK